MSLTFPGTFPTRDEHKKVVLFAACLSLALSFDGSATAVAQVVDSKFELFVTDTAESIRFYERLGFSVAHAKPDGYSTLRSGNTVIALSPVPRWLPLRLVGFLRYPPIGTEIVLYSHRLDQLQQELVAAGYAPGTIELQPWGDRDFRLTDPDGYYLRVSEGRAVPEHRLEEP
jgi:catechol 2,3-dioxygenase-like lactoylglutathione lyase family enzyme